MITPDFFNGCFEAFGALFVCKSIYALYKDKQVRGISKLTMLFFTLWGYWNIFYYSNLLQWFSFGAGICLALANSVWVAQMLYYNYYAGVAQMAERLVEAQKVGESKAPTGAN